MAYVAAATIISGQIEPPRHPDLGQHLRNLQPLLFIARPRPYGRARGHKAQSRPLEVSVAFMRKYSLIVTAALLLMAHSVVSKAGLDGAPARTSSLELIVFEHPDCLYCQVF